MKLVNTGILASGGRKRSMSVRVVVVEGRVQGLATTTHEVVLGILTATVKVLQKHFFSKHPMR